MSLKEDFDRDGLVIARKVLDVEVHQAWAFLAIANRKVKRFSPVEVNGPFGGSLESLPLEARITELAGEALGCGPHLYNFRLVVKDKSSFNAVFLHQDVGYHIGTMPKLSAFVALSEVTPGNGGMTFWLGTHKYGYLGDVGEIDRKHIPQGCVSICPILAPGDIVLMHSALWHESGPKLTAPDRIMADIIYQRADDPARTLPREGIFVRSRSSRLKQLQEENDALTTLRATS